MLAQTIAASAGALGAIASAVVAIYALSYLSHQVDESHQANTIADKAFYVANRPYVMFVSLQPNSVNEQTTDASGKTITRIVQWRISPTWRNFGKTPAININPKLCNPIIMPNDVRPIFTCTVTEASQGLSVLGPEQSVTALEQSIDDQTYTSTMKGTYIYILGSITYSDELIPGASHVTRFCYRLLRLTAPKDPTTPSSYVTFDCGDPNWNCIDNSCKPLS